MPDRWELGTLPFESLIGVRAAADFVARLDREELRAHEDRLLAQMVEGLGSLARRDASTAPRATARRR